MQNLRSLTRYDSLQRKLRVWTTGLAGKSLYNPSLYRNVRRIQTKPLLVLIPCLSSDYFLSGALPQAIGISSILFPIQYIVQCTVKTCHLVRLQNIPGAGDAHNSTCQSSLPVSFIVHRYNVHCYVVLLVWIQASDFHSHGRKHPPVMANKAGSSAIRGEEVAGANIWWVSS